MFLPIYTKGIMLYIPFYTLGSLFFLRKIYARDVPMLAQGLTPCQPVRKSTLERAMAYSSAIDGLLGCFQSFISTNNASLTNLEVFMGVCMGTRVRGGYRPRSGSAEP